MWPTLPQRQLEGLRSDAWLQPAHRNIHPSGLPSTEPGLIHRAKPSHSNDNTWGSNQTPIAPRKRSQQRKVDAFVGAHEENLSCCTCCLCYVTWIWCTGNGTNLLPQKALKPWCMTRSKRTSASRKCGIGHMQLLTVDHSLPRWLHKSSPIFITWGGLLKKARTT